MICNSARPAPPRGEGNPQIVYVSGISDIEGNIFVLLVSMLFIHHVIHMIPFTFG